MNKAAREVHAGVQADLDKIRAVLGPDPIVKFPTLDRYSAAVRRERAERAKKRKSKKRG